MYDRLVETTFLNEVFEINSAGEFGTISGFRLGKNTTIDIKWDEVNCALGQMAYLLVVLAHRLKYKFLKYSINLKGGFSTINFKGDKRQEFNIFYGQGSTESQSNIGLECFLDCIRELMYYCEKYIPTENKLQSKHIQKDLIKNSSIKFRKDSEEEWS
jgi:beclin 1